ncbi:collagenase, partial [Streptomyces sp. NPDC020800]|uniref:collagenase n=1 Tax=Streptomyces sp. NPDC020800 TaxID=3365092 RepID=UPI0037BC9EB6
MHEPAAGTVASRTTRSSQLAAAGSCTIGDFTGLSGASLVAKIKASCLAEDSPLFQTSGTDAANAFNEAKMITVANALATDAVSYSGNGSTGVNQLIIYLRIGYYVHWKHPKDVGTYGTGLKNAVRAALDAFFANTHSHDVSQSNGRTVGLAVDIADAEQEQARYLPAFQQLVAGFGPSYISQSEMMNAVFRVLVALDDAQEELPEAALSDYIAAVAANPGIIDALHDLVDNNLNLLGTDAAWILRDSGLEMGHFLKIPSLRSKVRPLALDLIQESTYTGQSRYMWGAVVTDVNKYDKADCSYYSLCNISTTLKNTYLTLKHDCSPTLHIVAQQMSQSQFTAVCTSMLNQNAYFHTVSQDTGPVADDNNTSLEVVIFASAEEYKALAGPIYGIDTDNGGDYEEYDPADPANQPRFYAYLSGSEVWNLNHEYTHYLDGRFDMYGNDYEDAPHKSKVWWTEGLAEYVMYSYLNRTNTAAIGVAGQHTYKLSELFDTEYGDQERTYQWGYLAVRYMLQSHRADVDTLLGYWRAGKYDVAQTYLHTTIGTKYDSDWDAWLTACAAGNCGATTQQPPANEPPNAQFTHTVNGLTASFTDTSTDADGTIASRSW